MGAIKKRATYGLLGLAGAAAVYGTINYEISRLSPKITNALEWRANPEAAPTRAEEFTAAANKAVAAAGHNDRVEFAFSRYENDYMNNVGKDLSRFAIAVQELTGGQLGETDLTSETICGLGSARIAEDITRGYYTLTVNGKEVGELSASPGSDIYGFYTTDPKSGERLSGPLALAVNPLNLNVGDIIDDAVRAANKKEPEAPAAPAHRHYGSWPFTPSCDKS